MARHRRPLLVVNDLTVHFPTSDGIVKAVDGLSYTVERGKTLGIVGESGSGKSVSSSAIMGLPREHRAEVSGQIMLDGTDILTLSEEEMRRLRGQRRGDDLPGPAVGAAPLLHGGRRRSSRPTWSTTNVSKRVARQRAIEMLDRVGIPQPDRGSTTTRTSSPAACGSGR